jgi:hypothetical protein
MQGDTLNRKHQLLIEGGVKTPSFLTGFTLELIGACLRNCEHDGH